MATDHSKEKLSVATDQSKEKESMPSHLTRKKRTAPLLAEKSFTIVSTENKKVHAHSLHKQMEPFTPLAAAADSVTLGLQMRAKNTRATGHTRKNKKPTPAKPLYGLPPFM